MTQTPPQFLVVGVGASAGGVEALQAFFTHVPPESGCAYVVILHLSPEFESNLASILQAVTSLPVTQVSARVRVEPGQIYVIPPSKHLTIVDGHIVILLTTLPGERRAPIDIFFRTLADSHHEHGVCVILSGTGSDGSLGLKKVKERGGAVFVQHPDEAIWAEMPRSAIATDMVDEVLPVAAIPARIAAYEAALGTVIIPAEPEQRPEEQQHALREIFTLLRLRTGHDFSEYKRPTLLRRIERRIRVRGLPDLPAYARFLHDAPDEAHALLKDFLISVTHFFRDAEAFVALGQEALPRLFAERRPDDQVRIWVMGCATGEEAYSIAMLCVEQIEDNPDGPSVQLFATDIDEAALARARAGLYTATDLADISPERLRRFFVREGHHYRVRRELRERILFTSHNLLKDPPFSQLDLISCRNVLIYLDHTAHERVVGTFHFALKPGGYLFLGTAETVDGAGDLFTSLNYPQRLFQRRQGGRLPVRAAAILSLPSPAPPSTPSPAEQGEQPHERISSSELHQRLLEQYAPPSLVVDADYEIVHLSERAGRYLQMMGGAPTTNLLTLIRPELRSELRAALFQATQHQANVEARNLNVRIDAQAEHVTLHVRPVLPRGDSARGLLLVLFEPEAAGPRDVEPLEPGNAESAPQLEEELRRLRVRLRTSSEQYELQAEELTSTNEELQALIEELRVSSEELETSKEELQALNEELRTVNQELKVKVEEATQTSADLQNLVNATDIATIFLDRRLCIKRYTPAALTLFNLITADHGRPLSDVTHQLHEVDVLAEAERVLNTFQPVEREVRASDGRVYVLRILPYREADDRIGGVVLTFVDITARAHAEAARCESEARLQQLYDQEQAARKEAEEANRLKDDFLATVSHELRTPLTAFLGYAQLLQRRKRDEAYVARSVDLMVQSAKAQAALIEDLLDTSRIVSGKLRIQPKPLRLVEVVHAALDTVRPTLEAKGLRLVTELDPHPITVLGDPSRLQQVVWNLLANAAKFTPSGGCITVQLIRTGERAELAVRDTGQGIAPAFLPYVFDRFRQADSSSQRVYGGLGLGLAIARHLVELHGGTIAVASDGTGEGATFTVYLPMSQVSTPEEVETRPSGDLSESGPQPPPLHGRRVLVVDDQPALLDLLADVLGTEGATVQVCATAREALALVRDWRPDVLVSDIAMPSEDGYWLIEQVRRLAPEEGGATPMVALTAYVRMNDRHRVLAAGFQQYVTKPVDAAELRDAVLRLAPQEQA